MRHNIQSTPFLIVSFTLSIFCFLFPVWSLAGSVQAEEWQITADRLTRYENPASVIAEGNVVLEKKETVTRQKNSPKKLDWSNLLGASPENSDTLSATEKPETITEKKVITTIKADWIAYDVDLGTIKARGNLLIDIGPDQLTADQGVVDLNQETGTFQNATLLRTYKDLHLEGRVIEKTGDMSYHIKDGWVITCKVKDGETPPWSFAAADAEITDNGYAFLKHATFRIKGIPVLYTPIMLLPAKRTRQTGFLFPSIAASDRDGFDLTTPFYINLSPSSDLTLYPEYIAKRGFMSGLEFRYTADRDAMGFFMANYLNDDLSDRNDPGNDDYFLDGSYKHTNQDRYWVRGKADHNFGEWTSRLDVDIASDLDYLTEFNSGLTGFIMTQNRFLDTFGRGFQNKTELSRENSLKFLRSWDHGQALQVNFLGMNDLREPKEGADPLWNLPMINYTGLLPVYDSAVDFSWTTNYTHFWREEGFRAQRMDIPLKLSAGIPLTSYLETTVDAGIRNTSYLIDDNDDSEWLGSDSENRFLVDVGGKVGTTMIRDFDINMGEISSWNHTFRPYVSYRYVSDVNQDDLPDFDDIDRIGDQNITYYGIDNFFTIAGKHNGSGYDREYGYLKLRQGYDFRSINSDIPLTPVELKAAYYPLRDFRIVYRSDIGVYGEGLIKNSLETTYKNSRGDHFFIDYFSSDDTSIADDCIPMVCTPDDEECENVSCTPNDTESITAGFKVSLLYSLMASYDIERSLEDSKTVQENIRLIYQPSCWSVELSSHYTPGDSKYMVVFRLANIGNPLGLDLPGL